MSNPIKNAIVNIIGEEKAKKLKEFFSAVNLNEDPNTVQPSPEPAGEPKVMATKGGKKLAVTGELKEGSQIMDVTGESPMPFEGTEELEDGTKVTALAGKITAIEAAVVQQAVNPDLMGFKKEVVDFKSELLTQFASHKIEFEKLKKENAELKATILDHSKIINENAKFMVQLLDTPVKEEQNTKGKYNGFASEQEWKEKDSFSYYKYRKENG